MGRKIESVAILGTLLATLCCATSGFAQVAVLGAPASAPWNNDVQLKILGLGINLGGVTVVNANTTTPTLGELRAFRAVLGTRVHGVPMIAVALAEPCLEDRRAAARRDPLQPEDQPG